MIDLDYATVAAATLVWLALYLGFRQWRSGILRYREPCSTCECDLAEPWCEECRDCDPSNMNGRYSMARRDDPSSVGWKPRL